MKVRGGRLAAAAAFAVGLGCLTPMTASAETIQDAMVKAYLDNPSLQAARAGLRATDEQVPQALANWRPDVSVTSSVGRENLKSSTATDRHQSLNPKDLGITVTETLFRGGRTLAETSSAENSVRSSRASLLKTEQQTLLDAATAYLNVFRDLAVLRLNVNQEQVLQRQLQATKDRFNVGEITRTDVYQAEARLASATASRIQAEGDLEASRANYIKVVGAPPSGDLELPKPFADLPDKKEDALHLAVTKNPAVISAEFDKRAALDNADSVWGELLPTVDVTASSTRSLDSSIEGSGSTTSEILLNLTVPIYQQGDVYSRLREARQTAAQKTRTIDSQRRDAAQAATQAWENMVTARAQVKALLSQIDANKVALEGVRREAAVGSRTVLDILNAEQELLNSRVAHVRAQRDELVANYQLKSAIGQLTARDLKLPVELYDPRKHYDEVRDKWFGGTSTGDVK